MFRYLFFDDMRLFESENVVRKYGVPELQTEAVYHDRKSTTVFSGPWVFKLDEENYRMLYNAPTIGTHEMSLFSAISSDGIHFEPDNAIGLHTGDKEFPHRIMKIEGEIACIVEDQINEPEKRYKLLCCSSNPEDLSMRNRLFTSPDLLKWKEEEGVNWGTGAEPIGGVFYNHAKECFTILTRPFWGVRMVGHLHTKDWKAFSEYEVCLRTDSIDEPLVEIYGMPAFVYENMFIGMPHFYGGFEGGMHAKYNSGFMKAQLAYSWDGVHWQRTLREPFISGILPDTTAKENFEAPMVWPTSVIRQEDGSLLIYAVASLLEHGPAFRATEAVGRIYIYRLREDGFICLSSANQDQEAKVAVRENLWNGGDLKINLHVKKATVAVYKTNKVENVGMNALAFTELVPGFSHEDCIPFSGDSTEWIVQYKNGRTLEELKEYTLAFEVKFYDGEIYSISGDMIPLFNTEGERYRTIKKLPNYRI